MVLAVCSDCVHGGAKDGKSHCGKESIYSYLTKCIQAVALEDYLERNKRDEMPADLAGNQ